MITLKEVKHYPDTNSVEATWVDRVQLPDVEVAEVPATFDEEGNELPAAVPAHTVPGEVKETQIRCHSYADVQMDMLRADLGADAADYEALIALVESNIKPPVPKTDKQHNEEVLAQIVSLETAQMLPRAVREVFLELPGASGKGWHAKVKKLDDDVAALKAQLKVIAP